jgi:hypothetical protein
MINQLQCQSSVLDLTIIQGLILRSRLQNCSRQSEGESQRSAPSRIDADDPPSSDVHRDGDAATQSDHFSSIWVHYDKGSFSKGGRILSVRHWVGVGIYTDPDRQ